MIFSFIGMTPQQVAALSPERFATVSARQLSELDRLQSGVLSAPQVSAMDARAYRGFKAAAIGRLSTLGFDAAITPGLAWLTASQAPGLSLEQIASLTSAQAATLPAAVIAALSGIQFDALSPAAIAALSATQVVGVRRGMVNGLSSAQLQALNVEGLSILAITGLKAGALNAFTTSRLSEFSRAQVRALTTAQITKLSSANLDALNPVYFCGAQVAGVTAAYVGALSVATFDASMATRVGALTSAAIRGLSVAQIESMSVAENAEISVSQFEAMSSPQQQAVLEGGGLIAEAKSLEVNGVLTYLGMLQVLQSAAVGGMNLLKFAELKLLASDITGCCGIKTSAYVEQIALDVIDGNTANAFWNGGSSTTQSLGNLTASSSQSHMEKLIRKWFLGADLPSLSLPTWIGYPVPSEYQAINLPLFGPGGPSYLDVNQGNVGDGYFLAALAETAVTDPTLIENMIQEKPNGAYNVCFQVDGKSDYVTVNNELPVMLDGYRAANGSTLEFANSPYAWSLLIEKAYVQLVEQTAVTAGSLLGVNGNAYADVAGGGGNGISVITGDSTDWLGLTAGESANDLANIAGALQNDLATHLDVLFASSSLQNGIGNLVSDQMFEVLAVNASEQMVLLQNPWNGSGIGSGKPMQFWESLAGLAMDSNGGADPSGFYVAKR